jgi:hypothetical protein
MWQVAQATHAATLHQVDASQDMGIPCGIQKAVTNKTQG